MRLQRQSLNTLIDWAQDSQRKPLLLRGARQVGKSYLVEQLAKQSFQSWLPINFELEPQYKACFQTLDPHEICNAIAAISHQPITAGETLLFLDEIQDCPQAIQALRYFKEKMPTLHVIAAGSLLELILNQADFRMPVGRVSFQYLYPLSFKEFLLNANPEVLPYIEQATIKKPMSEAIHNHLLKSLRTYMLTGGLPEACAHYIDNKNLQKLQAIQASIIATYENDFGHYHHIVAAQYLRSCFNKSPLLVGQQIKYNKINSELRSRELKQAISALEDANILQRICATSATGLPLNATVNEKKFKLNFIDIGLVKRFNQLDASLLLENDIVLLNNGALAEQFVGQELLVYADSYEKTKLYFWARDGSGAAEVDYLTVVDDKILPIEVKAGKIGKLKSLKQYLLEHQAPFGIRVSQLPLHKEENILTIPLYMLSELKRLCRENF